jgi:hypothetical protein
MLPVSVIHYSREDPRTSVGGVQRFARNLEQIFAEVRFLTPHAQGRQDALRSGAPIICDNQLVVDWPGSVPVIGFQHGVAAVKFQATRSLGHWRLARAQRRAAGRPNTLWVACARWVGDNFGRLYGNRAEHVVYYPVDTGRFDGKRDPDGRLLLHDARTRNKGSGLIAPLQRAFPDWRLEPLGVAPDAVPDRMRRAAAFLHLSRYEGNSLVCNEAMAMDLPCLFSRVGLFREVEGPSDVWTIAPELIRGATPALVSEVRRFLDSLGERSYHPRAWILAHATLDHAERGWRKVLLDFQNRFQRDLGLAPPAQGQR